MEGTEMTNLHHDFFICYNAIAILFQMTLFKNGECQGVAFQDISGGVYYPAISLYKAASVSHWTVQLLCSSFCSPNIRCIFRSTNRHIFTSVFTDTGELQSTVREPRKNYATSTAAERMGGRDA